MDYDENKFVRVKDLKNAAGQNKNLTDNLDNRTEILTYNNAWAHNSYCRGKNLGTQITDEQWAAIKAGKFADIYPNDYWNITMSDGKVHRLRVMGVQIYHSYKILLGNWTNHIVIRDETQAFHGINDTATAVGHIYNSYIYNTDFPAYLAMLEEAVGAEHVMPFRDYVADAISEESPYEVSHRIEVKDCKIFLPSYMNIMGDNTRFPFTGWKCVGSVYWPYFFYMGGYYQGFTADSYSKTQWTWVELSHRFYRDYNPTNPTNTGNMKPSPCFMLQG